MTTVHNLTVMILREGDAFVARCLELPVSSRAESVDRARAKLRESIQGWLEAASEPEIRERLANSEVRAEAIYVRVPDATEREAGVAATVVFGTGQV